MTAPDDPRAQAGECDVAAIGARAAAPDGQTWRVVDRCAPMGVLVTPVPQADGTMRWTADGCGSHATPRGAVLMHCVSRHIGATEILAPGEPSRAEALAAAVAIHAPGDTAPDVAAIGARAAAAAKAREIIAERFGENAAVIQHATDAVCASAADVPALLRHIAAEPARVAAAVAGERVRTLQEAAVLCREQRTMHRRMGHAQAIDRADGAAGCAEEIDALADALRAAEARAVAAEGAIAHLSHTLGCESDDPASIVREALDYAAEQRERADDRDEALVERDAAEARLAALAGAVDAVRAAHATATEAGAQYRAAWDAVDATPTIPQSEAIAAALRVSYEAQETLDAALTALLRGAPGGYVPARVVREYLRARDAHAMPRPEATTAALRDDVIAARTALDAALLAATTTPEESL